MADINAANGKANTERTRSFAVLSGRCPSTFKLLVCFYLLDCYASCSGKSWNRCYTFSCRYVSCQWLKLWANSLEAIPIDNSDILCPHDKLHPGKLKGILQLIFHDTESIRNLHHHLSYCWGFDLGKQATRLAVIIDN